MKPFGKHLATLLLILTLLAQATMASATTLAAGKVPVKPVPVQPPLADKYIAETKTGFVLRSSYLLELAILRESATAKDLADAAFQNNLRIQARDEAVFRAITQANAERLKAFYTADERLQAEEQLLATVAEELGVEDATDVAAIRAAWTKQHPAIALDAAIQRTIQDQVFERLKRIQSAEIWAGCESIYATCLLAISAEKSTSLQPLQKDAAVFKKSLEDLEISRAVLRPADYEKKKAELETKLQKNESLMQIVRLKGAPQMMERVRDVVQLKFKAFPATPFVTRMLAFPSADARSCFEVIPLPCDALSDDETAYVAELAETLLAKAKTGTTFRDLLTGAITDETARIDQDPDRAELHAAVRNLLLNGQEPIVLTNAQKKELFPGEPETWSAGEARLIETEQGWNLLRFKGVINAGNCVPWSLGKITPSYIVPFLDMTFRSLYQLQTGTSPVIRYSTRLDG